VTFDDDSAVENCMAIGPLAIKGKMVRTRFRPLTKIEVKRAQPKGREREEPRPGFQQRGYGGQGQGQFNQNGFGGQGMMNPMYGGMSPAMMAQIYQRMQAYYAAAMGRGMMPMGSPMMGMPNMQMQGMPGMNPAMMGGMPPQGMGGYQNQMPMGPGAYQQGYGSPEQSSHEGEYTYDNGDQGSGYQAQSPPPQGMGGEMPPSGPREGAGPPPNAPTGPSGGFKPAYGRGRGTIRGGRGGPYQGGMARGGNVRYNPYAR
jgi:RNA-binding protein Musashi